MARSRVHTSAQTQQSPLNSIKTNPISDKTYLNLLDPDFYLGLHHIVLTHRYHRHQTTDLLKKKKQMSQKFDFISSKVSHLTNGGKSTGTRVTLLIIYYMLL